MENTYISVNDLNKYLQSKFLSDKNLNFVNIKGEISNCKFHSSGHVYFTLKDSNSRINCVMFKTNASKLDFKLEEGMGILVSGKVEVYQTAGTYQIYVNEIIQDGIGNLFLKYEQLKSKLEKEGIFNIDNKKTIPSFPTKIAILSAYPSAAVMDILKTIQQRFPAVRVVIFPIPVQGNCAYEEIIKTLSHVDKLGFSTIILSRGGGSIEDLWNFNEEKLIYCIYNCTTPIISGIGHETDTTLCDYVSDYRALTPTAAAVKSTPNCNDLIKIINDNRNSLISIINYKIETSSYKLKSVYSSHYLKDPNTLFNQHKIKLDHLETQLEQKMLAKFNMNLSQYKIISNQLSNVIHINNVKLSNMIEQKKHKLNQAVIDNIKLKNLLFKQNISTLDALSPLKVLSRGYTVITSDKKLVTSSKDIKHNDDIEIKFHDGDVKAIINKGE